MDGIHTDRKNLLPVPMTALSIVMRAGLSLLDEKKPPRPISNGNLRRIGHDSIHTINGFFYLEAGPAFRAEEGVTEVEIRG